MHSLERATQSPDCGARQRSASPHRLPWAIALCVPLALLALLWGATADIPAATAVPPTVFATTYAGCDSLFSPNYTSIQEAVYNTAKGGTVNICPGDYDESVDLTAMNASGGPGDITIRKEPSLAGTVNWTAPDDALYVWGLDPFTGSVTIRDITFHDAADEAIDFSSGISGNVTLANVVVFRNRGDGVNIYAYGLISVTNVTADKNADVGLLLENGGPLAPPMFLDHVQANDNGYGGIWVSSYAGADVLNAQANDNGSTEDAGYEEIVGILVAPFYVGTVQASETVDIQFTPSYTPHVNIVNSEASRNAGVGVLAFTVFGPVDVSSVTANDNALDGVAAIAGAFLFAVNGVPFADNNVAVTDSTADRNGWLRDFRPDSVVETANGYYGAFAGFRLIAQQIDVNHANAGANQSIGYCLVPYDGTATVLNSTATANLEDGIAHDPELCTDTFYFFDRSLGAPTTEGGVTIAENGDDLSTALVVSNTTSSGNGYNGIYSFYGYMSRVDSPPLFVDSVMTVTNVTAEHNENGILIYSSIAFDAAVVSEPRVQISNSFIHTNTASGIAFEEEPYFIDFAADVIGVPAPNAVIASNIICENGDGLTSRLYVPAGGVAATDLPPSLLVADARGNWWGDKSGPNLPGTGDTIVKGSSIISETPWINTFLATAAPNPTIANYPTQVAFRFADAGQSYFLQEGVGNLNEAPLFTLSSSNGAIAPAATISQFLHDSYLKATLTPAEPGTVIVNVDGPCGLDPTLTVPVAAPAVHISKSPDLQGVGKGGAANFAITVKNTGDITLTQIAVADALAPDCNRSAGAIPNLAPNAENVYACSLVVNDAVLNEATVTAQALVNNQPSGITISAADDAEVVIASLSLSRTVWVDGYAPACQSIDKSLTMVPAGTPVKYCFTVTNTGDYTFTRHSLNDSRLGAIFGDFPHDLPPGASYSNVAAGVPATETITVNITGVTTWTGTIAAPVQVIENASAAAVVSAVDATAVRTLVISQPGDDQDDDGVDDIAEGFGDVNDNGLPDFLDSTPTAEDEENQPNAPEKLLLPSLTR